MRTHGELRGDPPPPPDIQLSDLTRTERKIYNKAKRQLENLAKSTMTYQQYLIAIQVDHIMNVLLPMRGIYPGAWRGHFCNHAVIPQRAVETYMRKRK